MCCSDVCRCIGLFLWYLFGGIILGILWLFITLLMCCTIIGIFNGWAKSCFEIAILCFYPEGWDIEIGDMCGLCGCSCICNIIWICLFGWEMFCAHMFCWLIFWVLQFCNIQLADYHWDLAWLSLAPFGSEIKRKQEKKWFEFWK